MGKSKKIRRGGTAIISAVGNTVKSGVELANTGIQTADSVVGVVKEGAELGKEGLKLGQQVAQSSSLITEKSGQATAKSLETLTTQIGNASDNVTALSKLSEQSLTKLTPGASDAVGNLGTLSGTLTSSINNTVTLGTKLIDSLLSILTLPFATIKSKIDKMNEAKPDATQKSKNFQEIKHDIIADFTKISYNTKNDFKLQIDNILKTIDNFIKLLRKTCPKRFFMHNCHEITNSLLDKIRQQQFFLIEKKSRFFTDIDNIFLGFNIKINSIPYGNGDLNKLYEISSIEQSSILTQAMDILSLKIKDFNEVIDSIETEVKPFIEHSSSASVEPLTLQSPIVEQSTVEQSNGGKKTKKRKSKKTKSKKSKTRKSKK